MRFACEELGTTFIKIGQLLSLRYDLISESDGKELQKLLDDVEEVPYDLVREIIKHDFGMYPEELFAKFPKKPIAAASISQVYKAKLHDGTTVAVKVRRPYLRRKIELDIKILRRTMSVAKWFVPILRKIDVERVIDQFGEWLLQEINFKNERKNIDLLEKNYSFAAGGFRKDLGKIYMPKVYDNFCSSNILTMEFVIGVPLTNASTIMDDPDYDVKKSVLTMVNASIRSLMQDKSTVFNGDPHPANIFLLKNGDVAIIDAGLMGTFSTEQIKRINDLFLAVYTKNTEETVRGILALCDVSYEKYERRLRKDIPLYLEQTRSRGIGFWFIEIIRICIKNKIPPPYLISLMGKANIVMDGLLYMVDKENTTIDMMGEELRRGVWRRIKKNFAETDYGPVLYTLSTKIKRNPEVLNALLERYYEQPLALIKDVKRALQEE